AHFAWHVFAHIGEVPILRSNQVRPVACRDIGLTLVFPVIAYSCQDGDGVSSLAREQLNVVQSEEEGQENGKNGAIHRDFRRRSLITRRAQRSLRIQSRQEPERIECRTGLRSARTPSQRGPMFGTPVESRPLRARNPAGPRSIRGRSTPLPGLGYRSPC